ncbi:hypothetical protein Dsin_000105 [Dipteronia sinensis]|uniref:Uncharacterized protein n=1 Tax=Dipteronia sinensis TaxID=43782 RepID=A0AAD9Z2Y2_9ROSI|nr:hypothetical protein Dsin_000105 [Dipteronia sinensis]
MTNIQVEHGLDFLYTKAWRAKEHAQNIVFGEPNLSYQLLPGYHQLMRVNSGTVTVLKTNDANQFKYMFIAHNASLDGFCTAIRPVICNDATHLKGYVKRNLWTSLLISTNKQLVRKLFRCHLYRWTPKRMEFS